MSTNVKQSAPVTSASNPNIRYRQYAGEQDIQLVKQLVDPELSEPYSIFTYRLFLTPWPQLCHFCYVNDKPVGVVVCKVDERKNGTKRGYLGMIVVLKEYRKLGIGSQLAAQAIESMIAEDVGEVALECEAHNAAALALYQRLGFIKEKRLRRYYLTGSDAIRLKLRLKPQPLPVDVDADGYGDAACQSGCCGHDHAADAHPGGHHDTPGHSGGGCSHGHEGPCSHDHS